jgi:hypothetical protein
MSDSHARPRKRALLVGVNKYPNLPDHSQLRGCVNDVRVMKALLEDSFQFPPENINVLTDEQATEQGIRAAMERLLADCTGDDLVVFHYSGHGSQVAAKGEKPRGYDESIMPYDSGRMNPSFPRQVEPRDIRDTEIRDWLARLARKTPHVTLIFDSCHSGSITRSAHDSDEAGTILRWIPPDPLPGGGGQAPAAVGGERGASREAAGGAWLPPGGVYVLLAACAADQGAYELEHAGEGSPRRHGAFTFYLTEEINQADGRTTYLDIWERVADKVTGRFMRQTPHIEGRRDALIFGVEEFSPMRYLLVEGREGAELRLKGGAVHGLAVGSRFEIYPAGTKRVAGFEGARLGSAEVTSVGSVGSRARIIEEVSAGAVAPNARAVEVVRADEETRMGVWLAPAPAHGRELEEMREALAQSKLLEVKDSVEGARVQLGVVAAREGAAWVVLDRSEASIMPRHPVAAPESKLKIRENLENLWRYLKVRGIGNERSALKGKVDFQLLKRGDGGAWVEVGAAEEPVYEVGEPIAFRVVNRSEIPLYASVLDLGVSKRIDVLYPPAGAGELMSVKRSGEADAAARSGGVLSVGNQPGSEIELSFPENLALAATRADGAGLKGKEIFKLVVTAQRHDLSFLRQSGLRKEPHGEPAHPLERLLHLATTGAGKREARVKLDPPDEWLTVERAFWLRQGR